MNQKMSKVISLYKVNTDVLLFVSIAIGVLLSLVHIFFSVDMYRDSANVYSYMARALTHGNYSEAFHPGIPLLNVVISKLFTICGVSPEKAMVLVSCLFYIATIPMLYSLLKQFLPTSLAGMGTLLFTCAPKVIRFSCTGIIDSGKIFFLVAALYFSHQLIQKKFQSYLLAILFGVALGGLTLVRSEGVGVACVLYGGVAIFWLIELRTQKKGYSILPLCSTLVVWGVLILSRMWVIWFSCGEFVFDRRINGKILMFLEKWGFKEASSVASTASSLRPVSWGHLLTQNIRGAYEPYVILAGIGLILIVLSLNKQKYSKLWPNHEIPAFVKWEPFYWIFLLTIVCNAIIFKMSDLAAYRYFLLNIPILMVFTMLAAYWAWVWGCKFIRQSFLVATIFAILIFQVINGAQNMFSQESQVQYNTGILIGEILKTDKQNSKVWFRQGSIEWYYSGTARAVPIEVQPPDITLFSNFDYVLWGQKEHGIDIIEKREDLQIIPLPKDSKVRLFKRINK